MIVTKLVSSKACVEKLYTDTSNKDFLNSDDIKLWIAEVFDLIKYPLQYIPKVVGFSQDSRYDFTNYKVPLPCDFVKFVPGGISVNGYPVRWRANAFHYLMDSDCCNLEEINSTILDEFTDAFGNIYSPQAEALTTPAIIDGTTFDVYNGEIQFSLKEGKACIAYYSLPIDNEGYIMIPDTAMFRRAVTDFLIWRTDYIKWRSGEIGDRVYAESKENKIWSIAAAASELKLPDDYQISSMKDTLVRLLPVYNADRTFYRTQNMPESRRLRS